jgi:L-fucose mutarotase
MLHHKLIHPDILRVIARAGHTSKILIADGNYPARTTLGPNAELISLNLSPNVVNCVQVLEALADAIPIEAANTMSHVEPGPYSLKNDPPNWAEYRRVLREAGLKVELKALERFEFYKAVASPDLVLTIQTADQGLYANLLLTVGVRTK